MGAWGAGLYSSDMAADMKAQIDMIVRLPVPDAQLWPLAARDYARAAEDPGDEDHSTFWLVLAHQYAKHGIRCEHTREMALSIIASGTDLKMMRSLEMSEKDLLKRQQNLEKIRDEIIAAVAGSKKRKPVMKSPEPFIMEVGACFAYPTRRGEPINPYMARKETYDRQPWVQDGWGAAILLERGHALGYFAWYRLAGVDDAFREKPNCEDVRAAKIGPGLVAGRCTSAHFTKMELEFIGRLSVVEGAIQQLVPELAHAATPEQQVARGVGIAGNLQTGRCAPRGFAGVRVSDVVANA